MRSIGGLRVRLKQWLWRSAAEERMNEEIRFHLEMETERNLRAGMSLQEARRRAVLAFGPVERHKEEMRSARGVPLLEDLRRDGWVAVRSLRRNPGFALIAVVTLGVGIGAGTAMFSVLDGVLIRELPLRDQEEVVVMWPEAAGTGDRLPVFQGQLAEFRDRNGPFTSVAGVAYHGVSEFALRESGRAFTASGTWVTGEFFPTLGVTPLIGRTLLPSDDVRGAAPVMVIGHDLWQRHFGGDPAALGRLWEWNGKHFEVVGVLPRGFGYPHGAEFWVPVFAVHPEEAAKSESGYVLYNLVGRLRSGATLAEARGDFQAFLSEQESEFVPGAARTTATATPLADLIASDLRSTLWTAGVAVGLLLLLACINVASLLLIRGSARVRELAIRTALGAGRGRLMRQLLTESGMLSAAGGLVGVLLAFGAVRAFVALAPPELPRREMIAVDARVLFFALVLTAVAALLSGVLPAVLSAWGGLSSRLRGEGRAASPGRGGQVVRHVLVIGQVSLSILVVIAAGLLTRDLIHLQKLDMGFNDDRLLVFQTSFPGDQLPDRAQQLGLLEEMLERVAVIPGVASATAVASRPFSGGGGWTGWYTGEGQSAEAQALNPMLNLESVGPGYFRTLELPLRRGRAFDAGDREDAPRVAIVSEAVARHTWPGEDPLRKRIKLGPPDGPGEWHTIVGVVGETRYRDLTHPQPSLYLPTRQFGPMPTTLAVRSRVDPSGMAPQIRGVLRDVHPDWLLVGGGTVRELAAAPLARPRFGAALLATFGAITLLLGAVGIYGAMAATVREREREMGIRLALGARVEQVRDLVLGQGMRLAIWGCALGLMLAWVGTRALTTMLFGISPTDPLTFATVATIVLCTAAAACYLPARRATRIDPMESLRVE